MMKRLTLLVLLAAGAAAGAHAEAGGTATFRVTFTPTWTADAFPDSFPGSAHWSPVVGAVHSADYSMFEVGSDATAGMERVAETGATATVRSEMTAAGDAVLSQFVGGSLDVDEPYSVTFEAHDDYRFVSLATMIAPSPDWFAGVNAESLVDDDGEWVSGATLTLFALDAGTEEGTGYSTSNAATSPVEPISVIDTSRFSGNAVAQVEIELLSVDLPDDDDDDAGGYGYGGDGDDDGDDGDDDGDDNDDGDDDGDDDSDDDGDNDGDDDGDDDFLYTATCEITFTSKWTAERFPDGYPAGAHWSPIVGAVHNGNYRMFRAGNVASAGMVQVAETGGTSQMVQELNAARDDDTVSSVLGDGGSFVITTQVTSKHPLVSLATMVAPSPDWFAGVDSVRTFDADEREFARDPIVIELFALDAGSDSGATYTAGDLATEPAEEIFNITGAPFNGLSVATVTIQLSDFDENPAASARPSPLAALALLGAAAAGAAVWR